MKISNSKKELASIISENGGWLDGCDFVVQDKDSFVCFYEGKPTRCGDSWEDKGDCQYRCGFNQDGTIRNWHQTILSRDEYFHLYPAPDANGWVEYCGTERPLGVFAEIIDVRLYDGRVLTDFAGRFEWNTDGNARIVAYRLSKQEQAKSNAVGDDETNLAAKEELEALEFRESPEQRAKLAKIYAPSIEQLAADYHSKLAIAQQAQEEADSHRCGAEWALERLYQAGLAIGLDIAIADSEPEGNRQPELVITDWRDLLVGDEVECTEYDEAHRFGRIEAIDAESQSQRIFVRHDNGSSSWPTKWRFIRRP